MIVPEVFVDGAQLAVGVLRGLVTSDAGQNEITLSGSIRWQICDDDVCAVPQPQRFEITVRVTGVVASELSAGKAANPKAVSHFHKLSSRHLS